MAELKKEFEEKFFNKYFESTSPKAIPIYLLKPRSFETAWKWIEQKIDEACKKQRETCALAYAKRSIWNVSVGDVMETIKNAPSPKESV